MSTQFKVTATLLVLVLVALTAGTSVYDWAFAEFDTQTKSLAAVRSELNAKELELRRTEKIQAEFDQRLVESLPGEPAQAGIIYQEYLVRLTEMSSLSGVVINSAQPERLDGLGNILHFSIQATGTTEQFGKLITAFYETEALHKITHVNLFQAFSADSPKHSLSLDVALLILDGAPSKPENSRLAVPKPKRTKLFANRDIFRRPAMPSVDKSTTSNPAETMSFLNNLLSSIPSPPATPDTPTEKKAEEPIAAEPAPLPPPPKPEEYVRLVGIIENGQVRTAIFVDTLNGKRHAANVDDTLETLGINSQILKIFRSIVQVQQGESILELSIGDLYGEGKSKNKPVD